MVRELSSNRFDLTPARRRDEIEDLCEAVSSLMPLSQEAGYCIPHPLPAVWGQLNLNGRDGAISLNEATIGHSALSWQDAPKFALGDPTPPVHWTASLQANLRHSECVAERADGWAPPA